MTSLPGSAVPLGDQKSGAVRSSVYVNQIQPGGRRVIAIVMVFLMMLTSSPFLVLVIDSKNITACCL